MACNQRQGKFALAETLAAKALVGRRHASGPEDADTWVQPPTWHWPQSSQAGHAAIGEDFQHGVAPRAEENSEGKQDREGKLDHGLTFVTRCNG